MDVRVGSCFRVDSETDNVTPEELIRFEADIFKADRATSDPQKIMVRDDKPWIYVKW